MDEAYAVKGDSSLPCDYRIKLPEDIKVGIPIKMKMLLHYEPLSWFPISFCLEETLFAYASIDKDLLSSLPSRFDRFGEKCYCNNQSPCKIFSYDDLFPVSNNSRK